MSRCDSSPSHADDTLSFNPDKLVNVSFDGDTDTVAELTQLVLDHYRRVGAGKPSGRDSNRNTIGGYSVRFNIMGK